MIVSMNQTYRWPTEFFAMMLGVRRPGITVAMQELERLGVVTCSRGRVVIVDRDELEALSTGTYTNAE